MGSNNTLDIFLQDAERIDAGIDSEVYKCKSGDSVIKVYSNLRLSLGKSFEVMGCLKMVEKYSSDTLNAKKEVDAKWREWSLASNTNDIILGGEKYEVLVSIIPQGMAKIIGNEVVSVGQEYVQGLNFKQIIECSRPIKAFEYFFHEPSGEYDVANEKYTRIRQILASVSYLARIPVGNLFQIVFQIDNKNVKPIIDEEKKILNLVVTDLAISIQNDYAHILDRSF